MNPASVHLPFAEKPSREAARILPAPNFRRLVWKSALLNFGIFLSALPLAWFMGGSKAIAPALRLLLVVSLVVWSATFTISAFMSLCWIFRSQRQRRLRASSTGGGVADNWLDGPG
ncbi:hypothetical protein ACYOEI_22850 [Singulisphaera rosea]